MTRIGEMLRASPFGLAVVDYVQLMPDFGADTLERLSDLAESTGTRILALSQVSATVETERRVPAAEDVIGARVPSTAAFVPVS